MSEKEDPVAARRNAIASVVRSFAWPAVALIAMYNFSGTLDGLVRSTQKVSFAGLAIETFATNNTLTSEQVERLRSFPPSQIVEFFSQYRPNSRNCVSPENGGISAADQVFLDAGLIERREGECGDDRVS